MFQTLRRSASPVGAAALAGLLLWLPGLAEGRQVASAGSAPAVGAGAPGAGAGAPVALGAGQAAAQGPGSAQRPLPTPTGYLGFSQSTTLGPVQPPLTSSGVWISPDGSFTAKLMPGWTSDPTLEVLLYPPASGHPQKIERFLLQVPTGRNLPPRDQRALVIGFHPFSVSEKSVFNASGLPQLCEQRGWYLLAPYGLVDTNMGNLPSQLAVDAILKWMRGWGLVWDQDRTYTAGFSMGGLNAVSYALRNQDPKGAVRIAGVINHTGTMDVIDQYNVGSLALQQLLQNPDHFAGTPTQNPFAWARVNPLRMLGQAADPNLAQVANLKDLRVYLHWNSQDPNGNLVQYNRALRDYLLAQGASVQVNEVQAGNTHWWTTLNMATAVDYVAQATSAPGPGDLGGGTAEIFADRTERYRMSEVLEIEPNTVARYRLALSPTGANAMAVQGARGVRRLGLDLAAAGLNPAAPLNLTTWTTDGKPLTLVLSGYATAPSLVLVGGVPPAGLSHDPATEQLTITPNGSGAFAVIDVLP